MNRLTTFTLAVVLPGVLGFSMAAHTSERTQSSAVQKPPRTIHQGGALLERLQPGDTEITVLSRRWRGLAIGPGKDTTLIASWLESGASAVVAHLRQGESRLTAAQDSIETDWTADNVDILRLARDHPFATTPIRFTRETGDLKLSGVSVHARFGWAREYQPGKKYLLFVFWDKKGSRPSVSESNAYQILDDGRLERVDLLQNEISQMTIKEVAASIRGWVRVNGGHQP